MSSSLSAYDVLALGELLVDLIGTYPEGTLRETPSFERRQGGSPANLVRTVALTGQRAALVACVGDDGLGTFLHDELGGVGVDTRFIRTAMKAPTTCVVLSRSTATSEFIAYRHADAQLREEQIPDGVLQSAGIVHTTAFALSREPARSVILSALRTADAAGGRCSIDVNYAPGIWPDRDEAATVLRDVVSRASYVKVSDDDLDRLFGTDGSSPDRVQQLHDWGADVVCLTRGPEGCRVSRDGGAEIKIVPAVPVDAVADATGAGDAFWGGFLSASIDGHDPFRAARLGSEVAAQKLQSVGPLTGIEPIDGWKTG
ncbi:carbohydrate kinase family protein [Longibacter sp.]|jgi:fructokinase|uniref:carbohydrate kinase family protein n=1 Tax=Longibacter sp. TaxID=2045415 RepID=UPI003EBA8A47